MMTREKIAAIDRECEEQHIGQRAYLESQGIARHQYYRWKRRYREEDVQSPVPAGFVPMMPGGSQGQCDAIRKSKGKQEKLQERESYMMVEIRTTCRSALRILGAKTVAHLREIITVSHV